MALPRSRAGSRASRGSASFGTNWRRGGDDARRGRGGSGRHAASRHPAGGGDVRLRHRHVADERVDLGRRPGPRHDRERRPGGGGGRGARVRRVHPHRQQDRRPLRPQARLRGRHGPLRGRRPLDGVRPERGRDLRLLGRRRRARRLALPPRDAVADPRQLRGEDAGEGLRAGRRLGRDRRGGRAGDRRLPHDAPVVARRLPDGGPHHRGRPRREPPHPRRAVHRRSLRRLRGRRPLDRRHGRPRARRPRLAGGRRGRGGAPRPRRGRARRPGLVARPPQARRQADAARPGAVLVAAVQHRGDAALPAAARPRRRC